ncbi:flippase [Cytobacillus firmus]|uniref:oligosaccharide flippase family protein n=1 Tax=Cytobacillus firmus TaxID=1399 RepID=UPI0018CD6248|nr:oligosaccharide flippase family protein [Cytobacillus firmus]MBG9544828.1 flippase [Cytobacillus firmus]MBG9553693.1 flippase [Cytobacillus firmus]MBG9575167.1 flippase [Cytobacillus firmus]MED4447567.1 oligosaccharide flippase family protein [Cytobacillus firmus]MED4769672.1 oligosaccharide flippase family protein [Cytobacillus firmus]
MNIKVLGFLKNFAYTLTSNLVALAVSVLVVLIVPKLVGVDQYGYWQLYLFYTAYVGFMHFGWNDGIYLRYGGKEYKSLDKSLFFSQFYMLVIMQLIISVSLILVAMAVTSDENRIFIIQMTALCLLLVNVRQMPLSILQGTNRLKEYAMVLMIGKILYLSVLTLFLLLGARDFKLLILADIFGRFISLVSAIFYCRDIIFFKVSTFYFSFKEAVKNINVGIKLLIANISSLLIIGVVRLSIERTWGVSVFGKVSLVLSIANLLMIFINALGLVLFPILKRTDEKNLSNIYITFRDILMLLLLGVLIIFYPLKVALMAWLPEYNDSLIYMALLFPLFLYEGKMALLINTYLKALRKEKWLLNINLITLLFSVIITFVNSLVIKNLDLAVISILILLAFRCIIGELFLSKNLGLKINKDILLELTMTFIFVLVSWFINSWFSMLIYTFAYIIYVIIKRKDISLVINNLRLILKRA